MSIHGVTERTRFSRGGHLRLGKKHPERGYPMKSDHFIADFEDPAVEALFHEIYGAEPKRVTVAFAGETLEEIFPQFYKCYGSSGLKCYGTGDKASRWTDEGFVEVECPEPHFCDFALANGRNGKPGCQEKATLQFFIQKLPVLQVFQVATSSINSIVNINSAIRMLQNIRGGQRISGVWVDLVLKEQDTTVDGKKTKIFVIDLVLPFSLDQIQQVRSIFEAPALPAPAAVAEHTARPAAARAAVPPPVEEDGPADDVIETTAEPAQPVATGYSDAVAQAFEAARTSDVKRKALLDGAAIGNWSEAMLLEKIGAPVQVSAPASGGRPAQAQTVAPPVAAPASPPPATRPPVQAPPAPEPEPESYVDPRQGELIGVNGTNTPSYGIMDF